MAIYSSNSDGGYIFYKPDVAFCFNSRRAMSTANTTKFFLHIPSQTLSLHPTTMLTLIDARESSPLNSPLSAIHIISFSVCVIAILVVTTLLCLLFFRRDRQRRCGAPRPLRHYSRFCTQLRALRLRLCLRFRLCCARLRHPEVPLLFRYRRTGTKLLL